MTKKAKTKSKRSKTKSLVKWTGHRTKMKDTVNDYGEAITNREISLSHASRNNQIYWCFKTVATRKGKQFAQQIIMRPDTLDEFVKLYYTSRGTHALEMDVRIAADTTDSQKKQFDDTMSKIPRVRKMGPIVTSGSKKASP